MPIAKTKAEMSANMREILRSRQPPGGIVRNVEAFKSQVDGSIVTNSQELREHNERNDVIDVREWGNDQFCDTDAKKAREEFYSGTSTKEKQARVETIKDSIQKLEAGHKPNAGEE